MSEEQLKLLKMIEEHKITAEEGIRLLSALNEAQAARERAAEEQSNRGRARSGQNREDDLFWGRRRDTTGNLAAERQHILEEARRAREEAMREVNAAREEARRARDDARREREEARRRGTRTEPLGDIPGSGAARFFRVRVSNRDTGEAQVDLRLPLALVNFGLKVGAKYIPEDITLNNQEVLEAVRSGAMGKILEVNNPESMSRVEIIIES